MAGVETLGMCAHGRPRGGIVMCPGCLEEKKVRSRWDQPGMIIEYEASTPPPVRPKPDNSLIGIGGGPTRATILPTGATERKKFPIATGLLDYFPDALAAISNLSYVGNEQHNPGQPVHWARSKSTDEADTMMRHFLQRGTIDTDGVAHSVKMAWRCLALLQRELEGESK